MRIGIITAGGDCAGLNAFIKTAVEGLIEDGHQVIGFKNGKTGMCKDIPEFHEMKLSDVRVGFEQLGGTILGSCRRNAAKIREALKKGMEMPAINEEDKAVPFFPYFRNAVKKTSIDLMIISGGDSSLEIFYTCCKRLNLPLIAIPKTVDNNIPLTDMCLGYSSAVEISKTLIDGISNTARSHSQWMVFQTMGGGIGELAMMTGVSAEADMILIPEIDFKYSSIMKRIEEDSAKGKNYGVLVVAEGIKPKDKKYHYLTDEIKGVLDNGVSVRTTIIGHYIRGCNPNAFDR
ncbi:MAG: 6-phosphofructokinase, partial [Rickettsiales bacterium]|nr:6-phosphofructokinase [Rickettsiales bacterium]